MIGDAVQNAETNSKTAEQFDIDAITELIVSFEFEFEGQKLKGRWYKYKTTTPQWAADRVERYNQRLERFIEISNTLKTTKDTKLILKLNKEKTELQEESQRAQYDWLADAIVEWNATSKGQAIPIKAIRLKSFPAPFMVALGEHLEADRAGENPLSSDSSSGA